MTKDQEPVASSSAARAYQAGEKQMASLGIIPSAVLERDSVQRATAHDGFEQQRRSARLVCREPHEFGFHRDFTQIVTRHNPFRGAFHPSCPSHEVRWRRNAVDQDEVPPIDLVVASISHCVASHDAGELFSGRGLGLTQ